MAKVEITVLGGFSASIDGKPIDLPGKKDRALLAFLAIESGVLHRRERLAGLLWGDSGEAQARDSLKHALARLRRALGPGAALLDTERETVCADAGGFRLDVAAFEALAESAAAEPLEQALSLWRGDLLDGTTVDEADFVEWHRTAAARLRHSAEQAAARYLSLTADNGDPEDAVAAARRVLRLNPLNEGAMRLLMSGLDATGDRSRALAAYRDFTKRLREALDVAPDPETVRLFETIRGRAPAASGNGDPPRRPSVAVLPFRTLAGDETWFAEGIAEEIITALSRVRGIEVMSRGSSFALDPEAVAENSTPWARYILRGSIQRGETRVRINVTLSDAAAGTVLWSETFQEALQDIFAVQDRIAGRVAGTLLPHLEAAEIARSSRKPTNSLDAYDYYLRGLPDMHRWSREPCERAMEQFRRATALDHDFAAAQAMLVRCYSQRKANGWMTDIGAESAEALRLATLAADLAPDDALVLAVAGLGLGYVAGRPEEGIRLTERALDLNPNLAWGWVFSGWMHVWLGAGETALEHFGRAMRLSPHDPQYMMMQAGSAWSLFTARRPREAVDWAEAAVIGRPGVLIAWCALAASRAGSDNADGARAAVAEIRRIDPALRLSNLLNYFPIRGDDNIANWTRALEAAGLPA